MTDFFTDLGGCICLQIVGVSLSLDFSIFCVINSPRHISSFEGFELVILERALITPPHKDSFGRALRAPTACINPYARNLAEYIELQISPWQLAHFLVRQPSPGARFEKLASGAARVGDG